MHRKSRQCAASFGWTVVLGESDVDAAYARADPALYAAKSRGRDRYEIETAGERRAMASALMAG